MDEEAGYFEVREEVLGGQDTERDVLVGEEGCMLHVQTRFMLAKREDASKRKKAVVVGCYHGCFHCSESIYSVSVGIQFDRSRSLP